MSRFVNPTPQILVTKNGVLTPAAGAKLTFFETGGSILKTVYSDSSFTTPTSNPIVADADGRISDDVFLDGVYKVVATESDGTQIWEKDPVGDVDAGNFDPWVSDATYNIPDIVKGSDDEYYRSLTDNNQGNDPTSSPASWEELNFRQVWNANVTYSLGIIVTASDGADYVSLKASNTGKNPTTNTEYWHNISDLILETSDGNAIYDGGMIVGTGDPATSIAASYRNGQCPLVYVKSTGTPSAGTLEQAETTLLGTSGYSCYVNGLTTGGSATVSFRQRIESKDVQRFIDQPAIFFCDVYHDVGSAVNYDITINKANVKDDFSAVTQIATTGSSVAVPSATATQISLAVSDMGSTGNGIEIIVDGAVGSAVTTKDFYLTDSVLVEGNAIVSFPHIKAQAVEDIVARQYRVMDYKTRFNAQGSGSGNRDIRYRAISPPMRTTPTVVNTETVTTNITGANTDTTAVSERTLAVQVEPAAAGQTDYQGNVELDATL